MATVGILGPASSAVAAVSLGLVLASSIALTVDPLRGGLIGVAAGVLCAATAPSVPLAVLAAGHALVCTVVAFRVRRARATQRRIIEPYLRPLPPSDRIDRSASWLTVLTVLGLAGGLACLCWWTVEPADNLPLSGGVLLLALAALAALHERARIALSRGGPHGVPVEARVGHSQAELRVGPWALGRFTIAERPASLATQAAAPSRRLRYPWEPAFAFGDLRVGGWTAVRVGGVTVLPSEPLSKVVHRPDRSEADDDGGFEIDLSDLGVAACGIVLVVLSLWMLPDTITVARGGGIDGQITVTENECEGWERRCDAYGKFVSDDGRYRVADVAVDREEPVGSHLAGVYVGDSDSSGEVYQPGAGDLWFAIAMAAGGIGVIAYAFRRPILHAVRRRCS
jgi:hypothetical protein